MTMILSSNGTQKEIAGEAAKKTQTKPKYTVRHLYPDLATRLGFGGVSQLRGAVIFNTQRFILLYKQIAYGNDVQDTPVSEFGQFRVA